MQIKLVQGSRFRPPADGIDFVKTELLLSHVSGTMSDIAIGDGVHVARGKRDHI